MRSTRSFTVMACLALASLFTFTSALGQDASETCPEVIASSGRVYFLIPNHQGETGRCVPNAPVTLAPTPKVDCPDTPVTGNNGETYFVPRFKRAGRCFFTDAVSTIVFPSNVPTPHEAAAGTVRVDADGRVRTRAPAEDPVEDPESSRGAAIASPVAVTPSRTPAPAEEANAMFRFETPGVPGHFMIGMDTLEPELGTLSAFVSRCAGNGEVWEETLEAAQATDRRAVELTARAKHVVGALRQDESVPQAVAALQTVSRSLTQAVERLNESSRADHAPLARLSSARALKDYGTSSCAELYDFAIGADDRNVAMTVGVSVVAVISWHIVLKTDGREAADRHWGFLNRLGGGFLSPPQPPPDES